MNKLPEQLIVEKEVERIATELMNRCGQDEYGESTDIFNGSAGILLFFLSLYKYNNKQCYLQTALAIANRLLKHADITTPRYYTFYGGAAGVLYICTQLYKSTGNLAYLEKALELERSYSTGFRERVTQCDLLSGQAGILLAVSHLYAYTKEPSLLTTMDGVISRLVSGAHIARTGLKWDTFKHSYDSLTGFSHGASGIAFALSQAGHYFGAGGLQYLAEQAFEYEATYFDSHTGNYMDLRIGVERMQNIRSEYNDLLYEWPLSAFQPTMSGISSWAHGAAGCALSRLFAFEATGEQVYVQQAGKALACSWEYFLQQQYIDYSLCSGYGGIAAVFVQAAKTLNEPEWHTRAMQIANAAIDYYNKQGTYNSKVPQHITDPGLFSGMGGVGYWLLGCLQSFEADDVLHPGLVTAHPPCSDSNIISEKYTSAFVNRMIYSKYYPETVSLWKQHTGFLQYRQRRLLTEALLEQYRLLADEQWLMLTFKTATHIVVTDKDNEQGQELYYCHEAGIGHVRLTGFAAILLHRFQKDRSVEAVAVAIQHQFFINENKAAVQQATIAQVKELVNAGFLIPATAQ
jgi:lantibiotic modifying enzyme